MHTDPTTPTNTRQAVAPPTIPFGAEAFDRTDDTAIRWLGMAGFLINSRGTILTIDAVLRDFDMPLLITLPITTDHVPRVDAVLVTHSDNDHCSLPTCRDLAPVTVGYHATRHVAGVLDAEGLPATGHDIGDTFTVDDLVITLTPADHAWQNDHPKPGQRHVADEDACGFWIDTPDGSIWAPGDSRLIPEHHLTMPDPDVLLFDFSDSEWHFGLDGAIRMANAYPDADLLLHHWGSVDAPDFSPFNGNPADLIDRVVNPGRIRILAPGQPFTLVRH